MPYGRDRMDTDAYYAQVRSAYDRIAPLYDDSVGRNAVSRRAKQLALRIIRDVTPIGGRLLDVGCYTGIEGLLLARQGFNVVGIDLSPEMVQLAAVKAMKWHLQDRMHFVSLRASDVGTLLGRGFGPFDTVYSVYGTLNLEPRITDFKEGLAAVLKADGAFVCGLLNPTVLYELLAAPLVLKFHGYRKLAKRGVRTRIGLGHDTVRAFLYSPGEFAALMQPEFRLEQVIGLHILYPPPRGAGSSGRWWVPRMLDTLELRLETRRPFSHLGFFSLLVFRKPSGRIG